MPHYPCMVPPPPTSALAPVNAAHCRVVFGAASGMMRNGPLGPHLAVALPVFGGEAHEELLASAEVTPLCEGGAVFRTDTRVAGFVLAPMEADLEAAARDLYVRIFAAAHGHHLYRVWNYVPQINAVEGDLENYRRFCRGRSVAFEQHFGDSFRRQLPAASAVGTPTGPLAAAFVAGLTAPRHCENPRQVPAFEYPPAYGPRPPTFSRATLVSEDGRHELFISGTAAIRGHATVAAHDLAAQLACTRDNLHVIAATAGAGADFGAADGWQRTLKVYVRRDTDLLQVRNDLERHLLRPGDEATYLQADLCRAELLVEIEAVLSRQ